MVTEWNKKAADMLGYSKAETMGKNQIADLSLSLYIYIYTHKHVHIYMHTYIVWTHKQAETIMNSDITDNIREVNN